MLRGADDLAWPGLRYGDWNETAQTPRLWTQIVGEVRLAFAPPQNHWWHVGLDISARGLTTGLIPFDRGGLQIDFDFVDHRLDIALTDGEKRAFDLRPMSVADFFRRVTTELDGLGVEAPIWPVAVELPERVRLDLDEAHAAYDRKEGRRFWRMLVAADGALQRFRSSFLGKCSPVQFFWGGFDLAVTRFSGRTAPPHPAVPGLPLRVTLEAYSHEVSSAGFWPGDSSFPEAVFFSYTWPEPEGFAQWAGVPDQARYDQSLREYVLPYEAVRRSGAPEKLLQSFFQATYEAGAVNALWDRQALERGLPLPEAAERSPAQSTANVPLVTP